MYLIVLLFIFSNVVFGVDYKKYDKAIYGLSSIKGNDEIKRRITELDSYIIDINQELNVNPEDAQLNYIKGRAIYAYIYTVAVPRSNQQVIEIKALKKEAYAWYKNAIKYDNNDLTVKQLQILRGYNSELAAATIDKIIEKDERLIGEDGRIVDLKRSKIVALIKLEKFEEAEVEVKALREDYPDRFKETSVAYYKEEITEAKKNLQAIQEKEANTLVIEKSAVKPSAKKVVVADVPVEDEVKDAASKIKAEKIAPESPIKQYGLLILALVIAFGLFLYGRRRNKK